MRATALSASSLVRVTGLVVALTAGPRTASAEWPALGRVVCNDTSTQQHPVIAADGADGAIIAWQDFRTPPSKIAAQHILGSGERDAAGFWPFFGRVLLGDLAGLANAAGGQTTPVIVADGAGGAIVAWQDLRSNATEIDLFAQHVLASGKLDEAWPANGTGVCVVEGVQDAQAMVPDGAGGAILTWMDRRPGASVVDIFAQHVLASGVVDPRWPANGLEVCNAPGLQELPAIVPDGTGGAIITWDDARGGATGLDIFAQHVLNAGTVDPAWPANGRAVCAANGDQGHVTIATDGAHGGIVAWGDGRVANEFHIFAQHVLASGAVDPAWPADGRRVSNAGVTESRPLAVPDGAGGAIVNWQAFTVQLNVFAQHVNATGTVDPAWPAGGRALALVDRLQTYAEIVTDGAGGAIVAWDENFDNVVAQHVLASGALDPMYPVTGRQVADLPGQQGDPALVATSGSGAIVTWADGRGGGNLDIFALQVLEAGTVGVPDAIPHELSFARPSPNPATGPLTLRFGLPRETNVRLSIYDAGGRRVRLLASGSAPAGPHAIVWDLRDDGGSAVGPGLYFARLEAAGRALTTKLAAVR